VTPTPAASSSGAMSGFRHLGQVQVLERLCANTVAATLAYR